MHIRVYKSSDNQGYFNCSLAIPALKDDEGYVLEIGFSDPIRTKQIDSPRISDVPSFESDFDFGESFPFEYDAPLNEHDFDGLSHSMSYKFSDEVKDGRRSLLFNLSIKGTPFRGYAFILPELYRVLA